MMSKLNRYAVALPFAIYAFAFVLLNVASACQESRVDDSEFERKLNAASIYEACIMNITSLERGDVLIRTNLFADSFAEVGPEELSIFTDTVEHHRVVFDFAKERFFYAAVIETKRLVFNAPNSEKEVEETNERRVRGFLIDGENRLSFGKPGRLSKIPQEEETIKVIQGFQMPDIRMFGLTPLGSGDLHSVAESVKFFSTPDHIHNEKDLEKTLKKITYRHSSGRASMDFDVVVDTERMVPVEMVQVFLEQGKRTDEPFSKETIQWQEVNGNMIAQVVKSQGRAGTRINRERHIHPRDDKAEIHCFSANEPLDDRLFDPDNIRDLDRLIKMCDPEWTHATSLLKDDKVSK